jgi:predicted P-loop ATPase
MIDKQAKLHQFKERRQAKEEPWRDELIYSANGQIKALLANAIMALRLAPAWQGVLAYDEFSLRTLLQRPPPWIKSNGQWVEQPWTDYHDVLTADWLQHQGIGVGAEIASKAVEAVARDRAFHPIRDYLEGLVWNGTARLANFAENYLGAEPTQYNRNVSRCLFISAVARIMRPGCKADHMPILEAPQGAGKSQAISILFSPYFSDDLSEIGTKDSAMQARVAWGIEVAELAAMTRGEVERIKAFISRPVDRFRPSYGRRVIEAPRQCVFIGSTNADAYLKDETGNRRFLPIRCGEINLDALKRDRDQLWAEAVVAFKSGQPWWINSEAMIEAREEQDARYQADAWEGAIEHKLRGRNDTSIGEVLEALEIERARWTQADQSRVARCLRKAGWTRYRAHWTGDRDNGRREWRYRRDPDGNDWG